MTRYIPADNGEAFSPRGTKTIRFTLPRQEDLLNAAETVLEFQLNLECIYTPAGAEVPAAARSVNQPVRFKGQTTASAFRAARVYSASGVLLEEQNDVGLLRNALEPYRNMLSEKRCRARFHGNRDPLSSSGLSLGFQYAFQTQIPDDSGADSDADNPPGSKYGAKMAPVVVQIPVHELLGCFKSKSFPLLATNGLQFELDIVGSDAQVVEQAPADYKPLGANIPCDDVAAATNTVTTTATNIVYNTSNIYVGKTLVLKYNDGAAKQQLVTVTRFERTAGDKTNVTLDFNVPISNTVSLDNPTGAYAAQLNINRPRLLAKYHTDPDVLAQMKSGIEYSFVSAQSYRVQGVAAVDQVMQIIGNQARAKGIVSFTVNDSVSPAPLGNDMESYAFRVNGVQDPNILVEIKSGTNPPGTLAAVLAIQAGEVIGEPIRAFDRHSELPNTAVPLSAPAGVINPLPVIAHGLVPMREMGRDLRSATIQFLEHRQGAGAARIRMFYVYHERKLIMDQGGLRVEA